MPRPGVGGPQVKTTGSEVLNAISTMHTAMSTATFTAREMRVKSVAQGSLEGDAADAIALCGYLAATS